MTVFIPYVHVRRCHVQFSKGHKNYLYVPGTKLIVLCRKHNAVRSTYEENEHIVVQTKSVPVNLYNIEYFTHAQTFK